jgi:enoyl-CoA hydratase
MSDIIFTSMPGNAGNLGIITLNRPQRLNALTLEMCQGLLQQLKLWQQDSTIKAVRIKGEGERAFCAGGDIRNCYEVGPDNAKQSVGFFWEEYRMNHAIFHFSKPYIALMHGITMGGGLGVSIHGSHRIAAEDLVLAMPETGIGLYPDIGGSYFLPRLLDKTGFYLGLSGHKIEVADAHYVGLINTVVPKTKFAEIIAAIADAKFSEDAKTSVTRIINAFSITTSASLLRQRRKEIENCFSHHTIETILAALENNKITWCEEIAALLKTRSPTSLKVTLAALQRGATMEFDDCMRMEYRMTQQFLQQHDFYEGIRAAIIDKDRNPKWRPANLGEVSPQMVEKYFEKQPYGELDFS